MKNFYTVLNCSPESTNAEIKQNYFELLRKIHPDKSEDPTNFEKFLLVKHAWTVLGNSSNREKYDFWFREQQFRDSKALIGEEIYLKHSSTDISIESQLENCQFCRCGGQFHKEIEDFEQIFDYALFECSNCSLLLKVWKKLLQ